MTFIGNRVSTDGKFSVETHIIGEKLTARPQHAAICFIKRLRDNKKFENLEALKEQIKRDIKEARKYSGSCELFLR